MGLSVGVAAVDPNSSLRDAIREADSRMYGDKVSNSGAQRLG
jgi:hypothetical protein